jgi:hypothetical protein
MNVKKYKDKVKSIITSEPNQPNQPHTQKNATQRFADTVNIIMYRHLKYHTSNGDTSAVSANRYVALSVEL